MGFDHAEFSGHYKWLGEAPRAGDYPTMFWLQEALKSGSRVFDFGGNVGISFFAWQNHVEFPADIHWMVEDVSSILDAGRAFAKYRPNSGATCSASRALPVILSESRATEPFALGRLWRK